VVVAVLFGTKVKVPQSVAVTEDVLEVVEAAVEDVVELVVEDALDGQSKISVGVNIVYVVKGPLSI